MFIRYARAPNCKFIYCVRMAAAPGVHRWVRPRAKLQLYLFIACVSANSIMKSEMLSVFYGKKARLFTTHTDPVRIFENENSIEIAKQTLTAPGIPRPSPIQVLTRPNVA